jgi:hypothetical protein
MSHHLISITPTRLFPHGPLVDVALVETQGFGRVAMVMPTCPEGAPPEIREGLVRRRLVMTTGVCPCGARLLLPDARIAHQDDCPAVDAALAFALGGST